MDGIEEVLYPESGCEAKDVLISLKLNNQLQSLLESDGGTSNLEIEFMSLTDAKIYSGSSVFSLKFSESISLVSISPLSQHSSFNIFCPIPNSLLTPGNIP